MSVLELLLSLRAKGVRLWAEDGRLRYDAPVGALTDDLRDRLRARRAEVVDVLGRVDVAERTAVRVPVRDGVSLAADVFRPRRGRGTVAEPLPVLWRHERYRRAEVVGDAVVTALEAEPWLADVLRAGYVVAVVDARGTGASTGTRMTEFGPEEADDAHDVTQWLAGQPWCDGNVGMFGDSYRGITQLLAAGTAPPALKAVLPQMVVFDLYDFLYPGGVFRDDFVRNWGDVVRRLDREPGVAPAGDDRASAAAVAEHRDNRDVFAQAAAMPFRDAVDDRTGLRPYVDQSPSAAVERINASAVPVMLLSGWYDLWTRDAVLWFRNLATPRRLLIGDWSHHGRAGLDLAAEHVRWFDHWLKGVDNGVADEPPVRYRTIGATGEAAWRSHDRWPPPGHVPTDFHFGPGPSGSVDSVNDGALGALPAPHPGADQYRVDYTTTSGRTSRWSDGYGAGFRYDLAANDRKALTYTTPPLPHDLEVTGHPVARLWVDSSHPDGDFFVYLQRVEADGTAHYVTEGVLRASHRAVGPAPFDTAGLPHHPGTPDWVSPLPRQPVELVVDLHPTSTLFAAGSRVRVSITCCDRDNAATPVHEPPPVVRVHRGPRYPSRIVLPVAHDVRVLDTPRSG